MSRWVEALAVAALFSAAPVAMAQGKAYPGIGRDATASEVAAWDSDVRPDFKGLPAGAGSVARGQEVWEAKCASCHGVFGESNQVFNPLVGGTSAEDVKTGRVASLKRTDYPGRTTLMKASSLSTLWDYINRAMPWSQPKSLSVEEVYAVTAYMLHLGDVLPADFTLSDRNIREVQQRLPNRNGTTTDHPLWPGAEFGGRSKPDVSGTACMKNCAAEPTVTSAMPGSARNDHGNLASQNRRVGAQRGIETGPSAPAAAATGTTQAGLVRTLAQNNCTACHASDRRLVGPSWLEIAGKYPGNADHIAAKIRSGGAGVWGAIPMPPQSVDEAQARQIANWLAAGAGNQSPGERYSP